MHIKLDENVDARAARLLAEAGHNAVTVSDQGMRGTADDELFQHCTAEGRLLVTLDKDFSNVLRYPPDRSSGVAVLRGPDDLIPTVMLLLRTLVKGLARDDPQGKLWIVEPGRVRIHETP